MEFGVNVIFVSPRDKYADLLEDEGFGFSEWRLDRKSINPFKEFISLVKLAKIYKESEPAIVHHFTIKACLYGTIAAKASGVYRVIMH